MQQIHLNNRDKDGRFEIPIPTTKYLEEKENNSNNKTNKKKPKKNRHLTNRQGVTIIYDILKAMYNAHEPLSRSRIFQNAYLTSSNGPRYLKQCYILGYIRLYENTNKTRKRNRYTIYPKFELTEAGRTHIYNIEKLDSDFNIILRNSKNVGKEEI